MTKVSFSTTWKSSTQPRKQRKYRYNSPLHVKQKLVHTTLSKDLRKKHGLRNTQVKTGDKVKILRGKFKGKEGKVERVSLKYEKVFVTGIENVKKDGNKVMVPLVPSNLMIVDLKLDDKKRKNKLSSISNAASKENKPAVKSELSKKVEETVEKKTEEKKE